MKIPAIILTIFIFISCATTRERSAVSASLDSADSIVLVMSDALLAIESTRAGESDDSLKLLTAKVHREMMAKYPVVYDWWLQDGDLDWFDRPLKESLLERLSLSGSPLSEGELMAQYISGCIQRREQRLKEFASSPRRIAYTKYHTLRPSFYAYTEGASDARGEKNFFGGGELMLLAIDGLWASEESLLSSEVDSFRDIDIHFDGDHMLFAWKRYEDGIEGDYHIYEMDLSTRELRQVTSGDKVVDIEAIYLPDDNILFNSSRCGSSVDCWFTEVSNMYICDRDGEYMRRVGFDQVHTTKPTLLDDGRVVYTRWDYNDRGQVYTQPLFQMNYDGTMQQEYYGLNSWFPTTATHVAQIPGTRKVMATILGHHNPQHGKLGIIDPEAGRDENEGVTLIAPISKPTNDRIDGWGQYSDQFQHPEPLNQTDFIISYTPLGYHVGFPMRFGIYWMNIDGERELLAYDSEISSCFPTLAEARERPKLRQTTADYTKDSGIYYMQDIYGGRSLDGIERGEVKKLRIVEIEFRAAGVGQVYAADIGGSSHTSSAVSIGNGSWDLKKVLGIVDVYPDGSAMFEVPSRVPLYFQVLDSNNMVIQTMRSWSTLQGGEMQSCVGCHEHKNSVPISSHPVSMAMDRGVQQITPYFKDGLRHYGFIDEVQPLLDRECISCHNGIRHKMSLKGDLKVFEDQSRRKYSDAYINLTHAKQESDWNSSLQGDHKNSEVNWVSSMSEPTLLKPYSAGAATSNLITRLKSGHGGNNLTKEEIEHIAMWIDLLVPFISDYKQAGDWSEKECSYYDYYEQKRDKNNALDSIAVREYVKSLSL